ncbi:MAG TPA: hypothetical protein VEI97_17900 [bacterium]|nr:hypothetical protein [bacterium]
MEASVMPHDEPEFLRVPPRVGGGIPGVEADEEALESLLKVALGMFLGLGLLMVLRRLLR